MTRVQGLARRELLGLFGGLRVQRIRERAGLIELERDERELLLGDLDLVEELVGLGLRRVLLRRELRDPRIRLADDRLELAGRGLVACGVGARDLDGALELLLALERFGERVVGGSRLSASQEGAEH